MQQVWISFFQCHACVLRLQRRCSLQTAEPQLPAAYSMLLQAEQPFCAGDARGHFYSKCSRGFNKVLKVLKCSTKGVLELNGWTKRKVNVFQRLRVSLA